MKIFINSLTAALFSLLLPQCANTASNSGSGSMAVYRSYDRSASLPSNPERVKVKVSLSTQQVYVMEDSTPLLIMPVSVGTSATPTPQGNFKIYFKDADRRAQTHGFALRGSSVTSYSKHRPAPYGSKKVGTPMPYWCEFSSGYGFHTGWLKSLPCTQGCLRMHENLAPKFFRIVSVGTPVNISKTQLEDSIFGRIKRPIDAGPLKDYSLQMRMSSAIFKHHKVAKFN